MLKNRMTSMVALAMLAGMPAGPVAVAPAARRCEDEDEEAAPAQLRHYGKHDPAKVAAAEAKRQRRMARNRQLAGGAS